jgi:hypothetical protein
MVNKIKQVIKLYKIEDVKYTTMDNDTFDKMDVSSLELIYNGSDEYLKRQDENQKNLTNRSIQLLTFNLSALSLILSSSIITSGVVTVNTLTLLPFILTFILSAIFSIFGYKTYNTHIIGIDSNNAIEYFTGETIEEPYKDVLRYSISQNSYAINANIKSHYSKNQYIRTSYNILTWGFLISSIIVIVTAYLH